MSNKKQVMNVEKTARRLKSLREGTDKKVKTKKLSYMKLAEALIEKNKLDIAPESLKASLINYEQSEKFDSRGLSNENYGKNAGMATNTLFMLADFYGVSTDYLLGISDFPSADEDFKKVHKLTGLSIKAIDELKKLATKEHFIQQLEAINFLIENEENYYIFGHIARFLWHDYKGVVEVLEKNSGATIHIPASKLNDTAILDIEKYLNKLKEKEKEAEKNKKHQKDNKDKK